MLSPRVALATALVRTLKLLIEALSTASPLPRRAVDVVVVVAVVISVATAPACLSAVGRGGGRRLVGALGGVHGVCKLGLRLRLGVRLWLGLRLRLRLRLHLAQLRRAGGVHGQDLRRHAALERVREGVFGLVWGKVEVVSPVSGGGLTRVVRGAWCVVRGGAARAMRRLVTSSGRVHVGYAALGRAGLGARAGTAADQVPRRQSRAALSAEGSSGRAWGAARFVGEGGAGASGEGNGQPARYVRPRQPSWPAAGGLQSRSAAAAVERSSRDKLRNARDGPVAVAVAVAEAVAGRG